MAAAYGPQYGAAVLRPLAEQLCSSFDLATATAVADIGCDGGTLSLALAARLPPGARLHVTSGGAAPLPDASCDRVGSLLSAGFLPGTFDEAERIAGVGALLAVVTWGDDPPAHEAVLHALLSRATGHSSPFLEQVLAVPRPAGWSEAALRDVVRFDGPGECWAAMVEERPLAGELHALPGAARAEVRRDYERALRPYEAADGTLRIPVAARLLSRR